MSKVSVRLAEGLNDNMEDLVDQGVFKDKTDAMHEAVRLLLLRYDSIQT